MATLTEDMEFSAHFLQRMRERRITPDDVACALDVEPAVKLNRRGRPRFIYIKCGVKVVRCCRTGIFITCARDETEAEKRDKRRRRGKTWRASEKRNAARDAAAKRRELIAAAPWDEDWGEP